MTGKDFAMKLLSVMIPIGLGFIFLLIVHITHPGSVFSHVNFELEQLKSLSDDPKKFQELLEKLQSTTWSANYNAVSLTAPILVTVVSIIVSYMYAQKQSSLHLKIRKDYFPVFRNIILISVTIGMILSGLSMQFWVICMDHGRTPNDYIFARNVATITNLLSWLSVYMAVFLLISMVSVFASAFVTSMGVFTFIMYFLWKMHVL